MRLTGLLIRNLQEPPIPVNKGLGMKVDIGREERDREEREKERAGKNKIQ